MADAEQVTTFEQLRAAGRRGEPVHVVMSPHPGAAPVDFGLCRVLSMRESGDGYGIYAGTVRREATLEEAEPPAMGAYRSVGQTWPIVQEPRTYTVTDTVVSLPCGA